MSDEHIPGFWIRLVEADARDLAAGRLPHTVQIDVQTLLADYDAHVKSCQEQIEKRTTKKSA